MFALIGFVVVVALTVYGAVEFYKMFRRKTAKTDWEHAANKVAESDDPNEWEEFPPEDGYAPVWQGEDPYVGDEYPEDDWFQEELVPPVKKPRKPRTPKATATKKTKTTKTKTKTSTKKTKKGTFNE